MHYIRWFVTYTTCNAIHLSNNWGRVFQKTNSSCYDPDLEDTSRGSYWKQISQFFIFLNSLFFLYFSLFIYFFILFFFWGGGAIEKLPRKRLGPIVIILKLDPKNKRKTHIHIYIRVCIFEKCKIMVHSSHIVFSGINPTRHCIQERKHPRAPGTSQFEWYS